MIILVNQSTTIKTQRTGEKNIVSRQAELQQKLR